MGKFKIHFAYSHKHKCPDERHPCRPQETLGELINRGEPFSFFETITQTRLPGEGDCHLVTEALMRDLIRANRAQGWEWVKGYEKRDDKRNWEHSWLECDGWAIDASNITRPLMQDSRPILVMDALDYRKHYRISKVTNRRNAKKTLKWLNKKGIPL